MKNVSTLKTHIKTSWELPNTWKINSLFREVIANGFNDAILICAPISFPNENERENYEF